MTYAVRRQSAARADRIADEGRRIQAETIIDVGAHDGAIARRLASDFAVTAVDDHPRKGTVHMTVTADNVADLGRADVVLALSVLHHMADWPQVLDGLRRVARKVLIVEVPHPDEQLRRAVARHDLTELHATVAGMATHQIGTAPAVHDPNLQRHLHVIPPIVDGVVFSGGGNHVKTQRRHGERFETLLGYRPYPGSLNLRATTDLGAPQIELRPAPQRCYQMWAARLGGIDGHAMIPDRPHPDSVEMLAPVSLRDSLGLVDGDSVEAEMIW